MFRTAYTYEENKRVSSCPGDPVKTEYALRVVDGNRNLVAVGTSSLYDSIQSHADSVDIHKILERCAMANDYSLLNRMPADFMDCTSMPKTLAEAHTMIQDAKNYFEKMPVEIKNKFDNNYIEFITSLGSKKFEGIVSEFLQKIKPNAENIVIEKETEKKENKE